MPTNHSFTVRAVQSDGGDLRLNVLAVPYGGPHRGRDSYGEYFTADTNLMLHDGNRYPVVHYHGMEEDNTIEVIGETTGKFWRRKDGTWMEVVLDGTKELARRMWQAAKDGFAYASSGAVSHLVRIDEKTGEILVWPFGELSLMDLRDGHTPANAYAVALPALRAHYAEIGAECPVFVSQVEPGTGGSSAKASGSEGSDKSIHLSEVEMDEAQLMQMLQAMLPQLVQMLQAEMVKAGGEGVPAEEEVRAYEMDEEQVKAVAVKALALLKKDSGVQAALKGELDEAKARQMVKAAVDSRMEEIADYIGDALAERRVKIAEAAQKAAAKAQQRVAQNMPAAAKTDGAGGVRQSEGAVRITDVQDRRYGHLSHEDMILGIALRTASLKRAGIPYRLDQIGLSEDYLRHAVGKTVEWSDTLKGKERAAVKAVLPYRANEFNATDIATQGQEWVETALGTSLWEKARNVRIYRELMARGMFEVEIPAGANAVSIPTEGNDPVAYSSPQANDLDATNRPEVTAKVNALNTGAVTLTPGEIKIAMAVTQILSEDSIINMAQQANRQLSEKAEETIEQLFFNGDTETGASTNLNLIDGTPGTGISRPYYLATNGMLKYPIITATTYSRSAGGALDITDYLNTRKKLPKEVRDRLDRLVFVVDSDTNMATLALPELTTQDVNRYATIEAGEILKLWGVPYFVSGFIELANSAGKVPNAGGTLGRILAVYPPYWAFGFRRAVSVETDRDILSGTDIYVASFRLGIAARGAGAAAASYNVGVTVS